MAPKTKKAQKVLLTDFLADTSTGRSWADEMDELPTAPAPRDPNESSKPGLGGSHLSRNDGNRYGDRDGNRRGGDRNGFDRPSRPEVPIPDRAPFNAFVGNLSWDTGSTELEQFFGAANIVSIRMISDNATGKPKGYGYVEFDTRDALVAALEKSNLEINGRAVRVSVAEPPKEREDRTGGAWRREGPPPTLDDRHRSRNTSNNFERTFVEDIDRGERMGFGSKFVPSVNDAHSNRKPQQSRGFARSDGGFAESDVADRGERMGFGSKFVPAKEEPRKEREPPVRGKHFVSSRPTPVGSEDGHSTTGGSPRKPFGAHRQPSEIGPTAADSVSNWRSARTSAPPTSDRDSSAAAPPTRRKLELSARTVPTNGIPSPPQSVTSTKPSPFGAAKPVDSAEREKIIQEKLDREREELAVAVAKKASSSVDEKPNSKPQSSQASSATPAKVPEAAPKAPKSNPFGAAKPVDTLQKELEVEEKLEREKKALEEKIKKEAEEKAKKDSEEKSKKEVDAPKAGAKSATAINPSRPNATSRTSSSDAVNGSAKPASNISQIAPSVSSGPPSKVHNPNSRWRSQAAANQNSKQQPNGNSANHPPGALKPATTNQPNPESATSPKSPNLSSFRKEGVSFAALAKTAASTPNTNQTQAPPPAPKSGKDVRPKQNLQPRTILKRAEEVEASK